MRRQFTEAERAAFTVGAAVEWLHGTDSHWHPGTIAGVIDDDAPTPGVPVRVDSAVCNAHAGEIVYGGPGAVRVPVRRGDQA